MKKMLAFLLALVMLLSTTAALAAPNDATFFVRQDDDPTAISYNVQQMAAVGSDVYMIVQAYDNSAEGENHTSLYRYAIGQTGDPELLIQDVAYTRDYSSPNDVDFDYKQGLGFLFGDAENLYTFNNLSGEVSRVTVAEGKITLDKLAAINPESYMIQEDDYAYMMSITNPIVSGGHMFYVTTDWTKSTPVYNLTNIDLATGESSQVALERNVGQLSPFRQTEDPNVLLAYCYALWDDSTGSMKEPAAIVSINASTGEITKLMAVDENSYPNGLVYDEASDTMYYMDEDTVWASVGFGTLQKRAYTTIGGVTNATLAGGCYVASYYNGVQVCNLDAAYLPTTVLNISGSYRGSAARAFTAKYPDIPLIFKNDYFHDITALGQAMVAGDDSIDVIYYSVGNGFETLLEKGYCADLSSSTKLMDFVSKMYPQFQKELMKDGKLYAVPVDLYAYPMSVSQEKLDTLGITMEELPTNYIDLCAAITKWNDEWPDNEETANLLPFSSGNQRQAVFELMLNDYVAYYDAKGMDLDFDTPLFHSMLEALDNMRSDNFDMSENPTDQERDEFYQLRSSLFNREMGVLGDVNGEYAQHNYCPTLGPDMDSVVTASMQVMFINPRSTNVEAAIPLLEAYVDDLNNNAQVMLGETLGGPKLNDYFDENVKSWQESLDDYKKMLTTAEDADKSWIQESIDYMEKLIENQENYRYDLSPDTIAEYRKVIGANLYASHGSLLNVSDNDTSSQIASLHMRYQQKQMTADQYIKELNAKVRMIVLENQ